MDSQDSETCQEWILRTPNGCLSTSLQFAAFVLGVLSILIAWIPAHILILRGKRKRNSEKLKDVVTTLHWALADGLNLSGAILAKQLATQVLQAVYFLAIDVVFLIIYCCFTMYSKQSQKDKKKKRRKKKRKRASGDELATALSNTGASTSLMCLCLSGVLSVGYLWAQSPISLWSPTLQDASVKTNGRTLLGFLETKNEKIGYALGILALICCWTSRIPVILQVYKNHSSYRQKTVSGLLILGNITYSLAIVGQLGGDTSSFHSLPWLLNSMGLIGLDLGILLQLLINQCGKKTILSRGHGSLLESDDDQQAPNHDGWLPLAKLEDEENVEELVDVHGVNHSGQFEEIKILASEDEDVHFSRNISPNESPRVVIKSSVAHSGSSESGCDADTELEWEDFNGAKKKKLGKAKNGQTQEKHKLLQNR